MHMKGCMNSHLQLDSIQGGSGVPSSDHLEDAARALILEWVDKLFSERITSYRGLALFLIDKMYVDTQSAAAQALAASVAREHDAIDGGTSFRCNVKMRKLISISLLIQIQA